MNGPQADAGTESKVSFILSGTDDETDVRTFGDQDYLKKRAFRRDNMDDFVMAVPRYNKSLLKFAF